MLPAALAHAVYKIHTTKPTEKLPEPAVVATNGKSETPPRELAQTH